MLASLLAQTDKDWQAQVIVDNPGINVKGYLTVPIDSRIKYTVLDKRYNDYGHTPREIFKQQSEAEYLIMTGDDNYYTPNMVSELRQVVQSKPGFKGSLYYERIREI